MGDIAIRVDGLSKQYRIGGAQASYQTFREAMVRSATAPVRWLRGERPQQNTIWALDDVSFEVKRGEAVGIIGRNGAGKSTLLKILSRITRPTRGRVDLYGRVGSLLEVGTGFHPELTGRENIFLNGAILGMTRREIERKFDEIVDFAEIEKFLDTPVKHYSSGMYVRLAFAVAAHLEPEILVVDEVLAVGDIQFQNKCLGKMDEVTKQGRTVLFVSHNMGAIQQLTHQTILLSNGLLILNADTQKVVEKYMEQVSTDRATGTLLTNNKDWVIDSFEFNQEENQLGFNKPLKFNFFIHGEISLREISFGMSIVNSVGSRLLTSTCIVPRINKGKFLLEFILRDHHLPPGIYSVTLGIDSAGVALLYREHVLGFNISDENIDNPYLVQRRDKIGAFIPAEYSIHNLS